MPKPTEPAKPGIDMSKGSAAKLWGLNGKTVPVYGHTGPVIIVLPDQVTLGSAPIENQGGGVITVQHSGNVVAIEPGTTKIVTVNGPALAVS